MLIFRIELVENIPEHLSFHADGSPRFPLSAGFHALLDQARYSVEMVSPVWDLNAWDVEAKQVQTGPVVSLLVLLTTFPRCPMKGQAIISKADLRGLFLMRSTLPSCLRLFHPFNRLEMLLLHGDAEHCSPHQGQLLFQRLLRLVSRGVKLKIVSSLTNSAELKTLAEHSELLSHPCFMKAKHNDGP